MAKVVMYGASYGMSVEIGGVWNKFAARIEVEIEPSDDINLVKEMSWNTVIQDVEGKVEQAREMMGYK